MFNLLQRRSFENIILDFHPNSTKKNDKIVSKFYDKLSFKITHENKKQCQSSCLRHTYTS